MPVLLVIGAIAVAILEIEAEIFDGLAPQFLDNARVDFFADVNADGATQGFRVRRILFQGTQGDRPEFPSRVRAEQMRAAVNGMDGLTTIRFARVMAHEGLV